MSDLEIHDIVAWVPLAGYAAKAIADAWVARKQKLEDRVEADVIEANKQQDIKLDKVLDGLASVVTNMQLMQKDLDALKSLPDKFAALERDVAILKSRPAGRKR